MMAAVNWRRVVGLSVCVVVAGGVGWFAAQKHHLLRPPVPRALTERRLQEELSEAARIGIDSVVDEREIPLQAGADFASSNLSLPLEIGERECVAIVAGSYGSGAVRQIALFENTVALTRDYVSDRIVGHVQWCSMHATALTVGVSLNRRDHTPSGTPNALLYRVARGRWDRVGGPGALTRGDPYDNALGRLAMSDPEDAFATPAVVPDGATAIAHAWTISMGTALLVPGSDRTYAALYRANARDAGVPVNPRAVAATLPARSDIDAGFRTRSRRGIDASLAIDASQSTDAMPWHAEAYRGSLDGAIAIPLHDPVVDLAFNDFRRIVAVVDPPAVHAGCITVVFHRRIPLFATELRAFDLRSWSPREVRHAGNTASDEVCPPSAEPIVYIVPDSDQAEYLLEIFASPSPR